jgi:hypothetical protein
MALNHQLWDGDPHQEVNLSVPIRALLWLGSERALVLKVLLLIMKDIIIFTLNSLYFITSK